MAKAPRPNPRRGEIWRVEFDPSVGAEIRKIRPAVVMSVAGAGRSPSRIVVPITDWQPDFATFSWFVFLPASIINGLSKNSGADTFQVKSVSLSRFVGKLGVVEDDQLLEISSALANCVGAP